MTADPAIQDQRGNARVMKPIDVRYVVDGSSLPARLEDLSEGGAYLDTQQSISAGSRITVVVEIALPGREARTLELPAEVAWAQSGHGAGVKFVDLSEEVREHLRYFIGSVFFGHS